MGEKVSGKDLIIAVNEIESGKLVEYASQNKSKKLVFTFKEVLKDLGGDEMDKMWEVLSRVVIERAKSIFASPCKGSPPKSKESPSKKTCVEVSHIIQAAIDLAIAVFEQSMPASQGLLHMVVYLNSIIFELPCVLENLKNSIALMCEKMFQLNYLYQDHELITFNILIYLMKRSLAQKAAKRDVKRIYALRSLIPKIISMREVDGNVVLDLYKQIASSSLYLSMTEGQRIISLILTVHIDHVADIHNAIKKYLPSATMTQGSAYGKVYFDAWSSAVKANSEELKNELEITCIQDLILYAVNGRQKSLVLVLRKLLAVFHCQKKESYVARMLYLIYQPILWRFLKNPDGLIRANTAQLFLDVFPLEDPDVKIVTTDMELTEQLLLIKDLLLDDFPIVRSATVIGLCIAMSINWELFPEDMLKTYFQIIVNQLSCDSSSADVRCAVAKGFKVLLENPLTVPTLQGILPMLKPLFHDVSDPVRIAFCQLLLRVKKICAIKYYDIVPLDHLLARMEEDNIVAKAIVNLIHNSYFPKNESPSTWLARCVEMIKADRGASRVFFQYVTNFISLETQAHFMIQTVKGIHFYVKSKVLSQNMDFLSSQFSRRAFDSLCEDTETMEEIMVLHDSQVVSGLFDAVSIMWLSSFAQSDIQKPENKNLLKKTVPKLSKCLGDLSLYYKDTPVWASVYYLSSLMPSRLIPSLPSLCFYRLRALDASAQPQDYMTLLECLCNSNDGASVLILFKEWIDKGFISKTPNPPVNKKRKTESSSNNIESHYTQHILAVRMLNDVLEHRCCQKILLTKHSEPLKKFLKFTDVIKKEIESHSEKGFEKNEIIFLTKLLYVLLQISVLLHSEVEEYDCRKYVEGIVLWLQEKLLKPVRAGLRTNTSGKKNTIHKGKQSASVSELALQMSLDVCHIITDMTLLGLVNEKSQKFLKFAVKLLSLEWGGKFLLPVSKLLLNHISYGIYLTIEKNDTALLSLVPDCFNKIIQCLNEDHFLKSVSIPDAKEVQSLLADSLLLMQPHNPLKELLTSITITVTKNILNSVLSSVDNWDDIEKECKPFKKLPISKSGTFLLSMMCMKPKIMVHFLQQLQKYLLKSGRDKQSWVACYVIVLNIWEIKGLSKTINKEIHCLVDKMEGLLLEHQPLKDIDPNLPLPHGPVKRTEEEEEELSFGEHCRHEYKKLKDLVLQKACII